jgi:hypothetical protein
MIRQRDNVELFALAVLPITAFAFGQAIIGFVLATLLIGYSWRRHRRRIHIAPLNLTLPESPGYDRELAKRTGQNLGELREDIRGLEK